MIKELKELGNLAAQAAKTKADGATVRGRKLDISEEELKGMYAAFRKIPSWQTSMVTRVLSRENLADIAGFAELAVNMGKLSPDKQELLNFQLAEFGELVATLKKANIENLAPQELYALYVNKVETALERADT